MMHTKLIQKAFLTAILCSSTLLYSQAVGPRPAVPADLTVWLTGSPEDAVVDLSQGPGLMLMGGGSEVTKTFANRAFPRIPGGNIVVLRTTGSDGYNDYFFNEVIPSGPNKPSSVETLRVDSASKANSDYVAWVLSGAEMIWFAGGDQSSYTSNWRGTKVEQGMRDAWARGALLGGTSAGMAIGGEFIYDPGTQSSLTTANAAANPYHPSLIITPRLFDSPWMNNVITDTHFRNRNRMGRLMGMMAHLRQEGRATDALIGVAASESSGIYIDQNGLGTVDLNANGDAVYILEEQPTTARVQVVAGQVLKYSNLARYRLEDGDTYNFADGSTTVEAMNLSIDGTNPASVYSPTDPYAVVGGVVEPPLDGYVYYEFFTDTTATLAQLGFTVEDLSQGNTWAASTQSNRRVARINFNSTRVKDDWLFTPAFNVEAGTEYLLEFWAQAGGSGTRDDFDVWGGNFSTAATMTAGGELLLSYDDVGTSNAPPILSPFTASHTFTATTTGTYRIAWHARSPQDQNDIRIDDITVRSLGVIPLPQELLSPKDGEQTIFPESFLMLPKDAAVTTTTVRLSTSPFQLDQEASVVARLTNTYFADPGTLVPGEAYYARVDASNSAGTTEGSVILFSALTPAIKPGDLFLTQNFDLPYAFLSINPGYPQLPKGFTAIDGDGQISATGAVSSWFVSESTLVRSAPNALATRYNPNAVGNNDWVFFPTIKTSATHQTILELYARARSAEFPETVEFFVADPQQETSIVEDHEFLQSITVTSTTYEPFQVILPPNQTLRPALRYSSVNQSQVLVDDVMIALGEPLELPVTGDLWVFVEN